MFLGELGYPEPRAVEQIAWEARRKAVNLASFILAVSGNGAVFVAGKNDVAALAFAQPALQLTEFKLVEGKGVNRDAWFFQQYWVVQKLLFLLLRFQSAICERFVII
jgi:hypothetical protein